MFANLPAICVKLKKLHIKKSSGAKLTLNFINRKTWKSYQGKKETGEVCFCLFKGEEISNSKVIFIIHRTA